MRQKIILNTLIIIGAYIIPLYFLNFYEENIIIIKKIQIPLSIVILLGSIFLTYINFKNRKQEQNYKALWFLFFMIGVLGIALSGGVLFLLFSLRHGIGF